MPVPVLRQRDTVIASVQSALSDADLDELQAELIDVVATHQARNVVIDVTVCDVMDSFATRVLRSIAEMCRLRGARTIVVGIQPDVAMAMVELGLDLGDVETALDLDHGLAKLAGPPPRAASR